MPKITIKDLEKADISLDTLKRIRKMHKDIGFNDIEYPKKIKPVVQDDNTQDDTNGLVGLKNLFVGIID